MPKRKTRQPAAEAVEPDLTRYSRQVLFEPIGEEGQRQLLDSRVTLIGCGALGSVLANTLVRAGVGFLRIIDRDYLELNNLQRQVLFDEDDLAGNLPKAEAAKRKLKRVNTTVEIEAVITDVNHRNIEELTEQADLLLDGTDNFETRFLINDVAVKTQRPWVYGACVGSTGLAMPIVPNDTPCLRCVFEQGPPPELNPTCDTAGILGPVVHMVAAHQAMEALKLLTGHHEALNRKLLQFDAWQNRSVQLNVQSAYDQGDCPCCKQHQFDYLEGRFGSGTEILCGRNAVQVTRPEGLSINFAAIAEKIKQSTEAEPRFNAFILKTEVEGCGLTLFADGRAIITGTDQPDQARSLYSKYIGS